MQNVGPLFKTSLGLLREWYRLVGGVWKVNRLLEPRVTIFGGAQLGLDAPFASKAHELGHILARENFSIITGGGPGIMRAVTCGATHRQAPNAPNRVFGVSVQGISEGVDPYPICPQDLVVLDSFFARKWLMINYSIAFIALPGGFGTIDELTEVLTLMQVKKLPRVPVVLIGTVFWAPFLSWLREGVLGGGLITEADLGLARVTDDLKEAVEWLKEDYFSKKRGKL